jgi:hypothetical protein
MNWANLGDCYTRVNYITFTAFKVDHVTNTSR